MSDVGTSDYKKFRLAFAYTRVFNSYFVNELIGITGNPMNAWNVSPDVLHSFGGVSSSKISEFLEKRKLFDVNRLEKDLEASDVKYLTFEDDTYPELLKQIPDPPGVLFYRGNPKLFKSEKLLAVVGSRKASTYACTALSNIISELKGTGLCIVSGMAEGIDAAAHKAALANSLPTVAVLGSGLNFIYPKSNKGLYNDIITSGGLVISEYPPDTEPRKHYFPERNRIVVGMCQSTLVGEAALRSGALISARLCGEYNRELLCIPGAVTNPNTEGIYKLIKEGAGVVTKAQDILDANGWELVRVPDNTDKSERYKNLSDTKRMILNIILKDNCTVDTIAFKTGLNSSDLMITLTELELEGYITQIDGDRYMAI